MQAYRYLAFCAALLASPVPAACTRADASGDARKAISAVYAKMNAAAARKDAEAFVALHTPDYVQVSEKGEKRTLVQVKKALPDLFRAAKSIQANTTIDKITLKGKTAVLAVRDHTEVLFVNQKNPDQPPKLVVDSKTEDTWMKTARGWLEKGSKTLSVTRTLNGKPMDAPAR